MNTRLTSLSNEHFTPPDIVEAARQTMGGIDLDPASCRQANRYIKATQYFTQKDNGYLQDWHGRVFCNPPGGWCDNHGQTIIKKKGELPCTVSGACGLKPNHAHVGRQSSQAAWWFKLCREYEAGRVKEAVFISFSIELLQTSQMYVPGPADLEGKLHASNAMLKRANPPEGSKVLGMVGEWITMIPLRFPICFPRTRQAYLHENAQGKLVVGTQPTHSSMIVYLPPKRTKHKQPPLIAPKRKQRIGTPFEVSFSKFGHVICPA
jgi:hypothetical protein